MLAATGRIMKLLKKKPQQLPLQKPTLNVGECLASDLGNAYET
jgi:hypothetical protein